MKNLILLLILIIFVQITLATKTNGFLGMKKKCRGYNSACKKNKNCCSRNCVSVGRDKKCKKELPNTQ